MFNIFLDLNVPLIVKINHLIKNWIIPSSIWIIYLATTDYYGSWHDSLKLDSALII